MIPVVVIVLGSMAPVGWEIGALCSLWQPSSCSSSHVMVYHTGGGGRVLSCGRVKRVGANARVVQMGCHIGNRNFLRRTAGRLVLFFFILKQSTTLAESSLYVTWDIAGHFHLLAEYQDADEIVLFDNLPRIKLDMMIDQ